MEKADVENKILDMLRSPEGEIRIQQIVREVLTEKIAEIVAETGLSKIEALDRLRGVPAVGA